MENHKSCSLGRVAHVYLIWGENHISENVSGWAVHFYHVNAVGTSLWNKTHSRMNVPLSLGYCIKIPCVRNHFCSLELYMLQKLPGQKKREFTSTFTITIYMLAGYSPSVLLPRITIHNQEKRLWELTKWSPEGKFFDLYKFSWRILWRMYRRSVWRICMLDTRAYKVTTILCCHGDHCREISMFFSQRKVQYSWLFSNCTCVFKKYLIY